MSHNIRSPVRILTRQTDTVAAMSASFENTLPEATSFSSKMQRHSEAFAASFAGCTQRNLHFSVLAQWDRQRYFFAVDSMAFPPARRSGLG